MELYAYIIATFVSLLASLSLTPIFIKIGEKAGFLVPPSENGISRQAVPDLGGIPVIIAMIVGIFASAIFSRGVFAEYRNSIIAISMGTAIVMLMGYLDDRKRLGVGVKFIMQIFASLLVAILGVRIGLLTNPFGSAFELGFLSIPITIIWIVAVTNAVNLVDGLDGLAVGVLAIAGLSLSTICASIGFSFLAIVSFALFGSTLGFLRFNYPPAKIILGNVGAYTLGFIVATASIIQPVKASTAMILFVPMLALGFPVLEMSITVVRRLIKRKKVYKGDTEHLHHLFIALGLPPKIVDWIFYSLSLLFATVAVGFASGDRRIMFFFLIILFFAFLVLSIKLASVERKGKNELDILS